MQRHYFKLTTPVRPEDENPTHEPLFPTLDQENDVISAKAMFGDLDAKWFANYYGMVRTLNATAATLLSLVKNNPMKTYADYKYIYHAFMGTIQKIQQLGPEQFSLPSQTPYFTDIIENGRWQEDKYFVQRRLAGQCPYFIRRVTKNEEKDIGFSLDKLKSMLSENFDWNFHLKQKYGNEMNKLVKEKRVFVLYHEHYDELSHTKDILDTNPHDNIKLEQTTSPIVLFVLTDEKELEVVAIQMDSTKKDSPVFTPKSSPLEWSKAKGHVEIVEMATCQLIGHLLETHATQEIICNLFPRHLGSLHPLHQLMTPHCQGTSPVGGLGLAALLDVERYMHRLFSIGYVGSRQYVNKYYEEQDYLNADFNHQLKRNGLADEDLIRYHPYRDDGKLIWNEIKTFAKKYVKLYYKSNEDVIYDNELQGLVNELSADGTAQNGGGKYKGFPGKFTTTKDLETFLTRFIWLAVKHAINSYPLIPYGAFVPSAPTKLYENPQATHYAHSLPNALVVLTQEVLTFTLASFRVNRLFDYSKLMLDKKARCLVKSTYNKLNLCVQKELEARNKARYERGDLTYQFMEPIWLPNSVHS
ncbi:polyunsaturated fatty acid 5-lipoxygenase-like isoform X2 [Clytia hemisphaerica]